MMRCEICNVSYKVGSDGLCRKCRSEILKARQYGKNMAADDDEAYQDMVERQRTDIRYGIDTSVADRLQREGEQPE